MLFSHFPDLRSWVTWCSQQLLGRWGPGAFHSSQSSPGAKVVRHALLPFISSPMLQFLGKKVAFDTQTSRGWWSWKKSQTSIWETCCTPHSGCNSCANWFRHCQAAGPSSIIRKFIFSFNNLWLLFPFTDGVTNYFIIEFFKTSYLLFGSISKTPTWLSLILMVGLPGKSPIGTISGSEAELVFIILRW